MSLNSTNATKQYLSVIRQPKEGTETTAKFKQIAHYVYNMNSLLGEGNFSCVYAGKDEKSGINFDYIG